MTLVLGIDTGGTYTDAVILRDETDVIASAKSLTTRHDLAIGIGAAVQDVLSQSGIAPLDILMASLSTTLATNALVEGQGERVGLVYIGFRKGDLEHHGLGDALRGDPVLEMAGGIHMLDLKLPLLMTHSWTIGWLGLKVLLLMLWLASSRRVIRPMKNAPQI